jgi:acyl carrier protein
MKGKEEYCSRIKDLIEEISLGVHSSSSIQNSSKLIGELGLDSLDYASVLLGCERWSGIKIKEDGVRWAEIDTVERLAQLFCDMQA